MGRVAVVQMKASTDKAKNLDRIVRYIEQASNKGAVIVTFPEFMMAYTPSSQNAKELASMSETMQGNFVRTIRDTAKDCHIDTVGTMYEKVPNRNNRVYDTSFLIDSNGILKSKYRKIHLYDALGFRESAKIMAGSKAPKPHKSSVGMMGMMICYDLRFPELTRMLASSGSQVIVAPSAWVKGKMKEQHWITLNQARAIENGCYIVSPDQIGNIYCGRSLVVDPFGKILLDMKKREGIGYAEISTSVVSTIRKSLPLLKNRRIDIYPDLGA